MDGLENLTIEDDNKFSGKFLKLNFLSQLLIFFSESVFPLKQKSIFQSLKRWSTADLTKKNHKVYKLDDRLASSALSKVMHSLAINALFSSSSHIIKSKSEQMQR